MRAQSPCYGCNDRTADCHTFCGRYIEYKRKSDEENAKKAKEKEEDQKTWDVVMKGLVWENRGAHRSTGRYRTRRG